jgi:hypothetical protein
MIVMETSAKINRLFEINTRVWLKELSEKYKRVIKLYDVPEEEFEDLIRLGFDSVWLMGVWRASEKGRDKVFEDPQLLGKIRGSFKDLNPNDIASSPYAIKSYDVDEKLGGRGGIQNFRKRLQEHGMKLILDFVPNHLALDHPWIKSRPDLFINGNSEDLSKRPELFFASGNRILAYGKDPNFPSWKDVAQLNYLNPDTRTAMSEELSRIASLCDGLRCDMAMLILSKIQKDIWGERIFSGKARYEVKNEFWQDAIGNIKKLYPDFIFLAEVYWGLERELISLGFDYVYDKSYYDALKSEQRDNINKGFSSDDPISERCLRFIENHDEDRAASAFGIKKSKAAAFITMLSQGAHLIYQGQLEGYKEKLFIELLRRPEEKTDLGIKSFYQDLLVNLRVIGATDRKWRLSQPSSAWGGNHTWLDYFVISDGGDYLSVVNYSNHQSQCYVHPALKDIGTDRIIFKDILNRIEYVRDLKSIASKGLYLDLAPYSYHLFKITGSGRQANEYDGGK